MANEEVMKSAEAVRELSSVLKKMTRDLILEDVLLAYDATERALRAANENSRTLPMELDLGFRLNTVHESLFKIRAELEEMKL
jgi:hypothetical protein